MDLTGAGDSSPERPPGGLSGSRPPQSCCRSCHDNPRRAGAAKPAKCLTCHPGEAIFTATEGVRPQNPHGSPHYGKESDCHLCHHRHEKSDNFCSQCHKFEFKVP